MPHAFILNLVSERAPKPPQLHQAAHGLFYHLLSLVSPEMSAAVHAAKRVPFTLVARQERGGIRLRVTLLDDELFAPLLSVLLTGASGWRLGQGEYRIGQVLATPEGHWRAGFTSWSEIADASPRSTLALEFLTPTVFATSGQSGKRMYTPVPETRLVLGGLLRSYQTFSPHPYTEAEAEVLSEIFADACSVTRLNIHTETHLAGKRPYTGFVGKVAWGLYSENSDVRQALGRMAALVFYSGIGTKTPYGMGQVALLG